MNRKQSVQAGIITIALMVFIGFGSVSTSIAQEEGKNQDKGDKYREKLENIYTDGLKFLVDQHHDESGAWPVKMRGKTIPDVSYTGFAVRILAEGPPKFLKKHLDKFKAGVNYILSRQQDNGSIIDPGPPPKLTNYKTSIALLALVSARDAYPKWKNDKFAEPIARARQYIANSQFSEQFHDVGEDHWAYGGFDYDQKKEKPDADMSNTQFALQALQSADLPEDHPAWDRAVKFLQRSQNRSESNDLKEFFKKKGINIQDDGGFMYYPAFSYGRGADGAKKLPSGEKVAPSYGTMTYAGLKSFIYAQLDKDDPRVRSAYRWARKNYTLEKNPGMSVKGEPDKGKQGLYYYFHTLAKALSVWGKPTIEEIKTDEDNVVHHWSRELVDRLAELQREDGFWKNEIGRWREDDPVLATSYSLLALNICRDWVQKEK